MVLRLSENDRSNLTYTTDAVKHSVLIVLRHRRSWNYYSNQPDVECIIRVSVLSCIINDFLCVDAWHYRKTLTHAKGGIKKFTISMLQSSG